MSRNVVALGLTSLFTDISSEMVVAVLPIYLTLSVGLSTAGFGLFEGGYQLVAAVFRLVGGTAADRSQDHRKIAASGYALSAATRVGLIISTGVALPVVPFLFLDRIGKGIRSAPRDALISLSVTQDRLATAFGVHRSLDTMGAMMGPIVASIILWTSPLAFDSVFVVSLAAAVVGVLIITLVVESKPIEQVRERASSIGPLVDAWSRPDIRRVSGVAGLMGVVTVADSFVYLILMRKTDLAVHHFPLLAAGTAVVYLILAMPIGRLADRIGRAPIFVAGHALLLGLYPLLATSFVSIRWVIPCLVLLGIFYACTDGVISAAVAGVSDESLRSSAIAVTSVAGSLGRLASAVAFGFAWDRLGLRTPLFVSTAVLTVALFVAWRFFVRPERLARNSLA